ncbi:MAG: iron-sulfur cluster-binding protein [Pseudomonadales bacterium]|nr:iron-sulfur cluster-binding protein [Pseudomonadales bacterium]
MVEHYKPNSQEGASNATSESHQALFFKTQSSDALLDSTLQEALRKAKGGFIEKRSKAIADVENFESYKQQAQLVKNHTLDHLAHYLTQFEDNVIKNGGHVHWASTPEQLNNIILHICERRDAKSVIKGKSMISEEANLNAALEAAGIDVTETDLGEYIIQLAKEPPSHIIVPAIHKTRQQVEALFRNAHDLGDRELDTIAALVDEARLQLRQKFLNADIGITGANMLIADTGSAMLVTNEGNGDLTATLPKAHIVTASIEKVVPDLESASAILRVLARSATGQPITSYTSLLSGPRGIEDLDGPEEFHVILLDNQRSQMLGTPFEEMLKCIKCGACLNHCPVYSAVGGHAYGWVYPGPMGSVLTPLMTGLKQSSDLPNASTFCGRCEEVCPMGIPLPELLRQLRNKEHEEYLTPKKTRFSLQSFMWTIQHPRIFYWLTQITRKVLTNTTLSPFLEKYILTSWYNSKELPKNNSKGTFMELYKVEQYKVEQHKKSSKQKKS